MSRISTFMARRAGSMGAIAAIVVYVGVAAAYGQETAPQSDATLGRIEFNHPGAAKKSVEIDLSREMFGDLFGIGDAFLAGVAEALSESPQAKDGSQAIQMAAEKAAAAREFVSIAKNVIQSVRVRATRTSRTWPRKSRVSSPTTTSSCKRAVGKAPSELKTAIRACGCRPSARTGPFEACSSSRRRATTWCW